MKSAATAQTENVNGEQATQIAAAFKEIAELHRSNRQLDREIEKLHQSTLKRLARIREHLAYVQANR